MDNIHIRQYTPQDRAAVRQICCDTADRGEPVERFFGDREVFADLLTRYYTEDEPEALWVAEHDGDVIGYLTGCLKSRRYQRIMAWRVLPRTAVKALTRGLLGSVQAWRLAWAGMRTWLSRGVRNSAPLARYPAHLHLNIHHGFRGRQVGRRLLEQFLDQVRRAGVRGVHAAVRSDNAQSCRFFERAGFVEVGRQRVLFPEGHTVRSHDTVIYGKTL